MNNKIIKIGIIVIALMCVFGIYYYKNIASKLQPSVFTLPNTNEVINKTNQITSKINKPEQLTNNSAQENTNTAVSITEGKSNEGIQQKTSNTQSNSVTNNNSKKEYQIPVLIDFETDTCIFCKMMAPILEEIKTEYRGKIIVKIIDVYDSQEEVFKYNIKVVPTQIFFDSEGKEAKRHEGYMTKEDIIKVFREMGIK